MTSHRNVAALSLLLVSSAALAQESATLFDTPVVAVDGTHRFEHTLDLSDPELFVASNGLELSYGL